MRVLAWLGWLAVASLAACEASAPVPPAAQPSPSLAPPAAQAPVVAAPAPAAAVDPSAVRAAGISTRIRFLADDLLEGRFTGSRGHAIAERYVATELASMDVEPAGDGGTYLQNVPVRAAAKDLARASLVVRSRGKGDAALKLDDDFILSSDLRTANLDVEAPLVFAGYGVTAPEYGYDDFAGIDVKGKIAVVLFAAPLSDRDDYFPPVAHAVYSSAREKIARLAARGAVGVLSVFLPETEERFPWARAAKQSRIEEMGWSKGGEPGASPPGVALRGTLHWKAFDGILSRAGLGQTTAKLVEVAGAHALKGFDLPVRLHARTRATLRDLESHNVVGVLRGSDPKLAGEYVVYSAHLDHLGVGVPVGGDAIYNGAVDNASGVAAILEIARAFSLLPRRPARSILFLACTGEERGLIGSDYFARFPTVPAGSIVADFNDDMVLALGPVHDVVALGAEHSSLGPLVVSAAAALGLSISPDPEPKQVHFVRSDQYSFVRQGIPSVVVKEGLKDAQGSTEAYAARRKEWVATRYHAPGDQWEPGYDYEGMAQVARVELLAGYAAASAPERPVWREGDVLGRMFGHK
jgi:hypothetical protein